MVFDMASAAKLMLKFSVKDDENVDIWIRDGALVYTTADLNE